MEHFREVIMKIASFTVIAALMASTAMAAQRPCADDVATWCKDVKPGGGRIFACLKSHEESVSATCKEHLNQVKETVREAQQACQDDIDQFCGNVQAGRGRMMKCLRRHQGELSPECRQALQKGHRM